MNRTWIYATSESDYENHLNERVKRAVIRSLDDGFSYFGMNPNASPHTTLTHQSIPLPPQSEYDLENDLEYLSKKDTRLGIEAYPNHGHIPHRSLISLEESGQPVCHLRIVMGTVIAYSPPPSQSMEYSTYYEFEMERQKEDMLYRILWDGSNGGIGYVEDVTAQELTWNKTQLPTMALAVHKSVRSRYIRKRMALTWKMESILGKLAVVAGLELRREIGQKVRLELLLERRRGMEKGGKRTNGKEELNQDGMDFEYYLKHPNQYMSSFQPPPPLPSDDEDDEETDTTTPRSKTKLTSTELQIYHEKIASSSSFAPSKLAERIKLASSFAFDHVSRNGLLDEYFAEREREKEREREESGGMALGEVRRSSRARNTVNYAEDGGKNAIDGMIEYEGRSGGGGEYPRKEVSGGPTAIYLLELLGFSKKSDATVEEEHEEEEGEDPFFEPDPCHVIDQLGRKHRYMTPANIQDAICRNIDGDPIPTPVSLLDEEQMEEAEEHTFVSDIICTTDDKVQDLPQFEPASFARCRFATRTFVLEHEDDEGESVEEEEDVETQKQAKAEAKAAAKKRKEERKKKRLAAEQKRNARLENLYRSKKSFELWRFKSIHGNGCAVWPLWSDRSKSLLKDMFVMSRVNSTADLAAIVPLGVEGRESTLPIADSSAPMDTQTESDAALAQSLAAAENNQDEEPLAKRRRTTRRAAGGEEPVFYGSHQSMSREQLISTLVRILRQAKPGSSSIMKLKQLVFATDFEASRGEVVEWRKLRSALGHLIFRMGRLGRLLVDVEGDTLCGDLLKEGALVKFELPTVREAETNGKGTAVVSVSNPNDALAKKLAALEQYVRGLHLTELSLRTALMKAIDKGGQSGESVLQISTVAIATAADELEGDAGAEDWKFFLTKENETKITWSSSDHPLIGQVIFRPSSYPVISGEVKPEAGLKCKWYKVLSYTPSVKGESVASSEDVKQTQDPNAFEPNPIVERRMRFRAIPIADSDIDANMNIEEDGAGDFEYIILTESQVRAGIEAALLHRKISSKSLHPGGLSAKSLMNMHPFKNKTGSKVMLTSLAVGGEVSSEVIYGVIAGHEYSVENNETKNKILILLEEDENNAGNSCAFWSTVNADGSLLTDVVADSSHTLSSSYKIDMHEYFQGSEAYQACEAVLTYLKNHQRSAPFAAPVDPVALQLPDYFDVIKNPMDISTLQKNLEEGKYSRIPPKSDDVDEENPVADHPVFKMLYGPFYSDAMLIFDNAILYNSLESWIGKEAELMKKNVVRKVDQVVNKATASWYRQEKKSSQAKKSIYAEEDSDVDMYEYESDYDDEEGGARKSRKGKGKKTAPKPRVQDDIPSKAIEKPYMLPENVVDFAINGSFPHMKIQTNVSRFALPMDWSCRHVIKSPNDNDASKDKEEADEEETMLSLLQMQQEEETNVRRSSRARTAPKTYTDEMTEMPTSSTTNASSQEPIVIDGAEFYLRNYDFVNLGPESDGSGDDDMSALPTASKSRVGVEGIRETLHEQFFAKLYRQHSPNAMILDNELGKYVGGSFPPYLGRVFDASNDTGSGIVWEIREQYVIPALRWILRGLVQSGHLAEVDGSLSEGIAADNDISITGPRAGVAFTFGSGVVVPNHEYYINEKFEPFEVLDEKEILRKRRVQAGGDDDESSDEEVELSAYEKMRAERVARNAERLKLLGLA